MQCLQGGSKKRTPKCSTHNFVKYWPIFNFGFTVTISRKFAMQQSWNFPPHLKRCAREFTHEYARERLWKSLSIGLLAWSYDRNCCGILLDGPSCSQVHVSRQTGRPSPIAQNWVLVEAGCSRFRAAQFRASQFRATQFRAAHFSAGLVVATRFLEYSVNLCIRLFLKLSYSLLVNWITGCGVEK